MKKSVIILIFLFFGLTFTRAQDLDDVDSLLSYFLEDDEEELYDILSGNYKFQLIYAYTEFETKTIAAGREIGYNNYNLSSQVFYLHSSGFYAGLGGAWYSQFDPQYSSTALSAGYGKSLRAFKNLRYRASYSRFFLHTGIEDYEPTHNSAITLGTTLHSKWIGTRLDVSFLLGNEYGKSMSFDIYSSLTLKKFKSARNRIRTKPEVSFYFGRESVAMFEESGTLIGDEYYLTEYISEYKDYFGYLNTKLILPIKWNLNDFDIEFSYNINLPSSFDKTLYLRPTSSFNFSIGYLIDLE